ncbi:MAG: undecaprenyldiphospho-muramoylpentapeptide beta-N-acetylglucosaminyltransferase [Flavobacteriales bacterium]|nr:undecaprenyldiphospho-muramoylpentapeptide beta-N-acetylglucosaminyltransferase [Flavobacteriales bacterium]
MPSPRVIISGGGTGGHIFPAIAIADAIREIKPNAEFLFVGAMGRMEMEKVPNAGYEIRGLEISGFQRSLSIKNLTFPVKVLKSINASKKIIKDFKPDVAVGVGGYASGPMLHVASKKKVPALIQEQNSFPGITNRLLARNVDRICVSYEGMEKWFPSEKILMTGNPIRSAVVNIRGKREKGIEAFGLDRAKTTLLIVGGSLGARTINESIAGVLHEIKASEYQIIWQTGKHFIDKAKELIENQQISNVKAIAFIEDMDLAYAAGDLIISRAGAMALSELCLIGKPSVLVPSPNVAEDHQTKNAMALVKNRAAKMVTDAKAREKLWETVRDLLGNDQERIELATNAKSMGQPNSANRIAQEVLKLIE